VSWRRICQDTQIGIRRIALSAIIGSAGPIAVW
jgi:hypothetical protein